MIIVEVIRRDGKGGIRIERFSYSDGVILDECLSDFSSIMKLVIMEVKDGKIYTQRPPTAI